MTKVFFAALIMLAASAGLFMRLQKIARLFLCAALLMQSISAFETDQYNLPPQPLADISDEVSEYTEQNLRKALDKINAEISARQSCPDDNAVKPKNVKCDLPDRERAKREFLRSNDAVAREVCNLLLTGYRPVGVIVAVKPVLSL